MIGYLYSMVLFVANVDEAQRVSSNAPRVVELSIGRPLSSKRPQEASRRIHYLSQSINVSRGEQFSLNAKAKSKTKHKL